MKLSLYSCRISRVAAAEVQTLTICGRVSRYYGGGCGGVVIWWKRVLRCEQCSAQIWGVSGKKKPKEKPGAMSCDWQLRDWKKTHPKTCKKKSELEKLNFKTSAVYPGDRHPDNLLSKRLPTSNYFDSSPSSTEGAG